NRRTKANSCGNGWRSRFKLIRQRIEGGFFERYLVNHVPAPAVRHHFLQIALFSIKNAKSGRAAHFMSRKRVEISIQILHVNYAMWNGLGSVNQNGYVAFMSRFNHLFYRMNRPQRV